MKILLIGLFGTPGYIVLATLAGSPPLWSSREAMLVGGVLLLLGGCALGEFTYRRIRRQSGMGREPTAASWDEGSKRWRQN